MKCEWVYVILRALESRLEWCEPTIKDPNPEGNEEEIQSLKEAIKYFKELKVS